MYDTDSVPFWRADACEEWPAGRPISDVLGRQLGRLEPDPDRVERGLAQLVLSLVELLRELMERQALRRFEAGTLSDEQVEQLGASLFRLAQRMEQLKAVFELSDEDLNLRFDAPGDLPAGSGGARNGQER